MRGFIVVAALLAAGTAQAQTTTCRNSFGQVICDTQQPPPGINWGLAQPMPNMMGAYMSGAQARAAHEQRDWEAHERYRMEAERAAQENRKAYTAEVAILVMQSRCDEAKDLALNNRDMDLADQAMRLCTPK